MWQTIRATLRHERQTCDRVSLTLLFPLPVLAIVILLGILGGRTPRDLPVAVVDLDHTRLSRELIRSMEATPGLAVVATPTSEIPALGLLRAGEVNAVVVLPHGLEHRATRFEPLSSRAWIDGQALLSHNLVARDLKKVFSSVGAKFEFRNLPDPIRVQARALYNPTLDYALFLGWSAVPAILQICFLVLLVHILGKTLTPANRTRWHAIVSAPFLKALGVRIAIWLLPFFVVSVVLSMITAQWLKVPLSLTQCFTLGLAWALLLLADVGWVVLTLGITGNHASSTSVAGFLGGPAFAFAGASFPVFSMPFFAHAWAWLLPTTPHLEMQSSIALMNGTLRDNLAPVGHLVLLIALTLPLGTWLLSRRDRALSQAGAT